MAIEVELPDGMIAEFPDGTPNEVISSALAKRFQPSFNIPGVQKKPEEKGMSWGDVAGTAVEQFIPSAKRALSEMGEAIMHPIDTASALGNVALGTAQKFVPGEQAEEKYADAVGQYFAERYGDLEGFKKAVAYDPAGVLSDLSTVFTGGGGALKALGKAAKVSGATSVGGALGKAGSAVSKVGHAVDPVEALMKGTGLATDAVLGGKDMASRLYESALKPSTTLSPAERTRVTETGLRERITPSQSGYTKAEKVVEELNEQIKQELSEAASKGLTVDPEAIANKAFESAYERFSTQASPTADTELVYRTIQDFQKTWGREPMGVEEAQAVKQGTYRTLKDKAYKGEQQKSAGVEAQKALARELKEAIAEKAPAVAGLNKRESDLLKLMTEVERATGRTNNWNILSLPGIITGGAMLEPMGGGAAAMAAAAMSSARSPALKARLAFALREGKIPRGLHNLGATLYGGGSVSDAVKRYLDEEGNVRSPFRR